MAARTIFHLDMDAFFVSVEELFDPSLKGKPVVVGGGPNDRGVVSAASYAARKFGVRSAMPLRTASRLCPQAVFLPGRPRSYRDSSRRVHAIMREFSPRVEMVSIDEAFLDLTGTRRLLGPPLAAAHRLHQRIEEETGLPCSIGIGASRLTAKISSGLAKPNGALWVLPGTEQAFLAPLDVSKIPGVGKVMQRELRSCGIHTIGQLAAQPVEWLASKWGKWGEALAGKARGLDSGAWFEAEIGARDIPKSVSHETTFAKDTADAALLEATLAQLVQLVGRRLREHGLYGRTVQLKLRYSNFSTLTRARTLESGTQLDYVILRAVQDLFRKHWTSGRPVRLLGVQAGSLSGAPGQLDLIEGEAQRRWCRALEAADLLRDRFGETSVGLGSSLGHGRRERVHENPAGLPGREGRGPQTR